MTDKELEQNIAKSFMIGMAFGFGSKYDEKDEILKNIREMIDEKDKKNREIKYKVGDTVRTLVDTDMNGAKVFPRGTIGTITEIIKTRHYPYRVEANGKWWYYYNDNMIELVDDDKSELTTYQLYLILLGYITEHTDKDNRHDVENALLELYKRAEK